MNKSKLGKTLVLFIFVYLIYVLSSSLWQLYKAGGRIEKARLALIQEKEKNNALKKRFDEVQSQEFIESEARNELNMQKPGETVVILPEMDIKEGGKADEEANVAMANWEKWLKLFK